MSVVSSAYFTTTVSFPIALRSEIMTTIVVNASTNWQTIPKQTNYNLADKKGPIRSKMPICIGSFYGCELTQSIVVFMAVYLRCSSGGKLPLSVFSESPPLFNTCIEGNTIGILQHY